MTGLDVREDRVIEISIVRMKGERVEDSLDSLVDPGPDLSIAPGVHGLDARAIVGAPRFADLADRVVSLLDGAVLVAHAAAWDAAFLEAELLRARKPLRLPFFLDTLPLSRRAFAGQSHTLGALADRLGIPRLAPHRAFDDVRVLRELLAKLLAELRPRTVRQLWHVRVGERRARPDIVEACIVLAETGSRALVSYRPSRRQPRSMAAIVTQVRTDLDPPRVMGYALPGRGRFDLRADRILSVVPHPEIESEEGSS